jgi:tetratricopeptide (TPR) repeat protein
VECLLRLSRIPDADREARASIRVDSSWGYGYLALAQTFAAQKQYDSALTYTRESVRRLPKRAAAWAEDGLAAYRANHPEEAKQAFEKALALDPSVLERDSLKQRVSGLVRK